MAKPHIIPNARREFVIFVLLGVVLASANAEEARLGDAMIHAYLSREAAEFETGFDRDLLSLKDWQAKRRDYARQLLYMLGLDPLPEKTPLNVTTTGVLDRGDYVVEKLHYQSCPKLYVTANLYRPAKIAPGERLPAVLYLCGHVSRGRNGNKTAYQAHGIWFARHGYACLVLDSLQMGEIAAFHHGTYNLERWSWHSRGYTPAGVETWNGIRGIDYLLSRPDVDPSRIAVTGISGGGAATIWVAAADERVKLAAPVSGTAELNGYVGDHLVDEHCDCMFFYNVYRWPWTRIAALIAPRPLLLVNSDQDPIFPMKSNEIVANRLERTYSLYGASDRFDAVVSIGGHEYRQDVRQAVFRFINSYFKNDSREVTDSETDAYDDVSNGVPSIPLEELRVFPTDADLPADQLNVTIDERFVPIAVPAPADAKHFAPWRDTLIESLRRASFSYFPDAIPPARKIGEVDPREYRMRSEHGIEYRLRFAQKPDAAAQRYLVCVLNEEEAGKAPAWVNDVQEAGEVVVFCEPRGIGATRWKRANPPNYAERSHALLGRTVDAGRVWDALSAVAYLRANENRAEGSQEPKIRLAGSRNSSVIAAYATVLDEKISGATLIHPPPSHLSDDVPQFLNVLRIGDIQDALGLIAPRSLLIVGSTPAAFSRTEEAYRKADAASNLMFRPGGATQE